MTTSLARPHLRSRVDRLLQPLEQLSRPGRGHKSHGRTGSPSTRGNDWHRPGRRARSRSRWWSALVRIEVDDFPTARLCATEWNGGGLRPSSWWCRRGLGW
eukprot:scaffold3329_cov120-Isochrysis_galbana.AAC.12